MIRTRDAAEMVEAHRAESPDIPLEAVQGLPVPVIRGNSPTLAFPFFLAKGRSGTPRQVFEPRWIGYVSLTEPTRVEFEARSASTEPLGTHAAPPGTTFDEITAKRAELYDLLDQMLASGPLVSGSAGPPAMLRNRFGQIWNFLEQKPLAPIYRSLNPEWFAVLGQ